MKQKLKNRFCKQKISIPFAILIALIITLTNSAGASNFTSEVVGSGKPVILIPGLMSDQRVWDSLAVELSKTNSVHRISIAGFGETPAVKEQALSAVKQQLLTYIAVNKLDKPAIIGHSLGGFMAFWLAAEKPDMVGPIVSVDGLPFIGPLFTQTNSTTVDSLKGQAETMKGMYGSMTQQQLVAQTRFGLNRQAKSESSKNMIIEMAGKSSPAVVGDAVYTLMTHDLRSQLSQIKSPILLLGASGAFTEQKDHLRVRKLYNEQLSGASNAKLMMNTDSRHFIMFDDASWLNQQVVQFLAAS
jgi:pimeloyl-ACP methyl ester carboxylesterase